MYYIGVHTFLVDVTHAKSNKQWECAHQYTKFVTGFAKRGLPHTSNLPTLTICNFGLVKAVDLKFGQQEVTTWVYS